MLSLTLFHSWDIGGTPRQSARANQDRKLRARQTPAAQLGFTPIYQALCSEWIVCPL